MAASASQPGVTGTDTQHTRMNITNRCIRETGLILSLKIQLGLNCEELVYCVNYSDNLETMLCDELQNFSSFQQQICIL